MPFLSLAFLCGDLFLQSWPQLPSVYWISGAVLLSLFFHLSTKKYLRLTYLPLAFTLGFAYTALIAHSVLAWQLPSQDEGRPMLVRGYVASLPEISGDQTKIFFAIKNQRALIRLTFKGMTKRLMPGDEWQLKMRLKRIHGLQNPGGFDYEAWSLQRGLRAVGYVVEGRENQLIRHQWYRYPLVHWRENIRKTILPLLPISATSHWLLALTIGERATIAKEEWQVLRNTGTNHLMAIAGLHIGLLVSFLYCLWRLLMRIAPAFLLRFFTNELLSILLLSAALLYGALSGFSLPAQRACLMLFVFTVVALTKRHVNHWHVWSLAMLLVLIINPLTVLEQSFWLSFSTIALIIYGMSGRLFPQGLWWHWGRVQYVIGVGLIPISLMLFQECSLISLIANSIAIPWLGFLILPFCLLSVITLPFASVSKLFLLLADKSLSLLWCVLTWFSHLPLATWHQAIPSLWVLIVTIIGFIILLMPRGLPGRVLSIILIMPLLLYQSPTPKDGQYWLTMLDVGQGLSVVIQTKSHLLVYDAGPKFGADFDMGESVVLPYLRTIAANTIDMLVISHGDNDHLGGSQAIMNSLPVKSIKTTVPEKITNSTYCLAGQQWRWDGVQFSFIYPANDQLHLGNDSSCVLRIDNGKRSVLLTGDIEKYAERVLLATSSALLRADVLTVPHHGSKTSGLAEFIQATHPSVALYSLGYRNRYHFPNAAVVSAYSNIEATQVNTSEAGAIQLKIDNRDHPLSPQLYRKDHPHYWQ